MTQLEAPKQHNKSGDTRKAVGATEGKESPNRFGLPTATATAGLFFIHTHNFGPFNASKLSLAGAISAAAAIALFSYTGIEAASVAAGRVRNPIRNMSRATVLGTIGCASVYSRGILTVSEPSAITPSSVRPHRSRTPSGSSWARLGPARPWLQLPSSRALAASTGGR